MTPCWVDKLDSYSAFSTTKWLSKLLADWLVISLRDYIKPGKVFQMVPISRYMVAGTTTRVTGLCGDFLNEHRHIFRKAFSHPRTEYFSYLFEKLTVRVAFYQFFVHPPPTNNHQHHELIERRGCHYI